MGLLQYQKKKNCNIILMFNFFKRFSFIIYKNKIKNKRDKIENEIKI